MRSYVVTEHLQNCKELINLTNISGLNRKIDSARQFLKSLPHQMSLNSNLPVTPFIPILFPKQVFVLLFII